MRGQRENRLGCPTVRTEERSECPVCMKFARLYTPTCGWVLARTENNENTQARLYNVSNTEEPFKVCMLQILVNASTTALFVRCACWYEDRTPRYRGKARSPGGGRTTMQRTTLLSQNPAHCCAAFAAQYRATA